MKMNVLISRDQNEQKYDAEFWLQKLFQILTNIFTSGMVRMNGYKKLPLRTQLKGLGLLASKLS